MTVDRVIMAVGIVGNVEKHRPRRHQGQGREDPSWLIDEYGRTGEPGVYAIGDLAGPPWLAHKAMHEGVLVRREDRRRQGRPPYGCRRTFRAAPIACRRSPSVGLTEEAAKANGREIKVGKFPFIGSGKAIALAEPEGLIKTIFDAKTGELLGAHMIGAEVDGADPGLQHRQDPGDHRGRADGHGVPASHPLGDDARVGTGGLRPDAPYLGHHGRNPRQAFPEPGRTPPGKGPSSRQPDPAQARNWIRCVRRAQPSMPRPRRLMRELKLRRCARKRPARTSASAGSTKHATFMIMGEACTRACAFCNVATGGPGAARSARAGQHRRGRRRARPAATS